MLFFHCLTFIINNNSNAYHLLELIMYQSLFPALYKDFLMCGCPYVSSWGSTQEDAFLLYQATMSR